MDDAVVIADQLKVQKSDGTVIDPATETSISTLQSALVGASSRSLTDLYTLLDGVEAKLDSVAAELAKLYATGYKRLRVDLTSARASPGTALIGATTNIRWVKIYYYNGTTSDLAASTPTQAIRVGSTSADPIDLQAFTVPDSDVVFTGAVSGDIYLTNSAQSGKLLILLVGTA